MKRADATTVAPESLSSYIQARFDEFSRSQKDVAQYIVDHLDDVAFQTAEELARRANTSSSTVVRFSQALGFEGYPELQHSAREEYRRRHAPGPKDGIGIAQRRAKAAIDIVRAKIPNFKDAADPSEGYWEAEHSPLNFTIFFFI